MREVGGTKATGRGEWNVDASIAHYRARWVGVIGLGKVGPLVAKTIRRNLPLLLGQMTNVRAW